MSSALPPSPAAPAGAPRLPWEERRRLGFVEALVQTFRLLVLEPGEAFSRLRQDGDVASPVLFGIIVSWICWALSQMWSFFLAGTMRGLVEGIDGLEPLLATPSLAVLVVQTLLWPVYFLVIAFIGTAVLHVSMMIVGGTAESDTGFEGTLKVYTYAWVSWIAVLIPFAGAIVAMLWNLVLLVIGLASVHRASEGRAVAAVLIPGLLCCVCAATVAVFFGAMIARLAQEGMP